MNASIAESYHNITGVVIKERAGTDNEKIAGSFVVIETTEVGTDEPVLVIRAFNPKETFINGHDVADVMQAAIDYVKEVANTKGAKVAVVIDDHQGGVGTNRQKVHYFQYDQLSPGLEKIQISAGDVLNHTSTTFNGYDISHFFHNPAKGVYLIP